MILKAFHYSAQKEDAIFVKTNYTTQPNANIAWTLRTFI